MVLETKGDRACGSGDGTNLRGNSVFWNFSTGLANLSAGPPGLLLIYCIDSTADWRQNCIWERYMGVAADSTRAGGVRHSRRQQQNHTKPWATSRLPAGDRSSRRQRGGDTNFIHSYNSKYKATVSLESQNKIGGIGRNLTRLENVGENIEP